MKKENSMKKSYVLALLIGLIAVSTLIGYQSQKNQLDNNKPVTLTIVTLGRTTTETFDQTGITALKLLKINHEVKLIYGDTIKCIDDVCAESGYWWPLYINNKKASLGAGYYKVKGNDEIEFRLSKK